MSLQRVEICKSCDEQNWALADFNLNNLRKIIFLSFSINHFIKAGCFVVLAEKKAIFRAVQLCFIFLYLNNITENTASAQLW